MLSIQLLLRSENFLVKCERAPSVPCLLQDSAAEGCPLPLGELPDPTASSPAPGSCLEIYSSCRTAAALAAPWQTVFAQPKPASLTEGKNLLCKNAIKRIALKKNSCSTAITNHYLLALINHCRNWC